MHSVCKVVRYFFTKSRCFGLVCFTTLLGSDIGSLQATNRIVLSNNINDFQKDKWGFNYMPNQIKEQSHILSQCWAAACQRCPEEFHVYKCLNSLILSQNTVCKLEAPEKCIGCIWVLTLNVFQLWTCIYCSYSFCLCYIAAFLATLTPPTVGQ